MNTGRAAIFVLGMHRSGTSALTRMLNLLGASLPRHVLAPAIGNESGHWEPEASVRLHDRLLEVAETSVNDLCGPSDGWFQTAMADEFGREMKELVRSEFGSEPLFVFKDPRSALVFPLWRRVLAELGIRCGTVIISRNPLEVAQSLAKRQVAAMPEQSWSMDRGGLLWLRYMLAAERHTRGLARSFCMYDDVLNDWRAVADRLARDLDLAWPRPPADAAHDIDGFLSSDLRHHHASDRVGDRSGMWSSWVAPVFDALRQASAGGVPDRVVFDAIGQSFNATCAGVRPGSLPVAGDMRLPLAPVAAASREHLAGRKQIAVVATASLLAGDHGPHLRALIEAAAQARFAVTIVTPDVLSDTTLDALVAVHDVDIQCCEPPEIPVEPAVLRPTIALFRHLRDRHFDAILFPDFEGHGHASIIAKQAALAFAETTLVVLAFGSARWLRERQGEFPSSLVTIATEHIERQAIQCSDLVVLPSPQIARWMEQAGWTLESTLASPDVPVETQSENGIWAELFARIAMPARGAQATRSGEAGANADASANDQTGANDVTIVIPHFEQPALLEQNLEALALQTDRQFSVVVVDDGSRSEEASRYLATIEARYRTLDLHLIRQDNRYLGAARNAGIRSARTDFVILLDDDNVAFPDMVETLRLAIHRAKADVVTCGIRHFHDATGRPHVGMECRGPDQFFTGGPLLLGAIHNCFGDASGIYRRAIFERIGHFHELHGVSFEDWHFHLRAVAAGLHLVSLPEPLVWYRVRPDSQLRTTRRYDNARVIASTVNELRCSMLAPLADYLMGSEAQQVRLNNEIARLTGAAGRGAPGVEAVASANAAALLEAKDAATRHTHNLEAMLEERTKSQKSAEDYARSLEKALAELRASHETATAYAVALERSRAQIEAYAKHLETEYRKLCP